MAIAKTGDYDLALHVATARALWGSGPGTYLDPSQEWLNDAYVEDMSGRMYSDPELLRTVLLDSMIFLLQYKFWPNVDKTGRRQCPIDELEVELIHESVDWQELWGRGLEFPVCTGPVSSSLVESYESMPFLISSAFFQIDLDKIAELGISLLERYDNVEANDVEWPLLQLVLHPVLGRRISDQVDSIDTCVLSASNLSTNRDQGLAWHLYHCHHSGLEFAAGNRLSGFADLGDALFWADSPWASSYFDYQIQQSCLRRSDLSWEEWLKILHLCSSCANRSYGNAGGWLGSSFDLLGVGSDRGTVGPIDSRVYWAWRTGYVVAMGNHLREEIVRLLNQDNADFDGLEIQEYKEFEELSFALDLMISLGRESEWHLLRGMYARMMIAAQRDADNGPRDDAWPADYEEFGTSGFVTYGPDSVYYWFLRIGYIDGMINRASSLHESDDTSAFPTTLARRNPDTSLATGGQLEGFGEALGVVKDMLEDLAVRDLRNQDEIMSAISQSRDEVVTVMADRLPPGPKELRQILQRRMGETWNLISKSVKSKLIKAERLSRTLTDDDYAKLCFAQSVEGVLQTQLVEQLIRFMNYNHHNTAKICFRDTRGVRHMDRKHLKTMSLSEWAGIFDMANKTDGDGLAVPDTDYFRGFLLTQFGEGTVDKVAQLSGDLQRVQDLRGASAHFRDYTTSDGLEDLRDLITGNGADALITKIIEVLPRR